MNLSTSLQWKPSRAQDFDVHLIQNISLLHDVIDLTFPTPVWDFSKKERIFKKS